MQFLTRTGFNLVELLCFEEMHYQQTRSEVLSAYNAGESHLFDLFDCCREIIGSNRPGSNILRYLLYHLNNKIITDQRDHANDKLSGLRLAYVCIPFDNMPFCTSLLRHNPRLGDLFDCIDAKNRMHEFLARYVLINTESKGQLYTPRAELERFDDIDALVSIFNQKLYDNARHQARRIEERSGHFYIRGYENDTVKIINKLIELSKNGLLRQYFPKGVSLGGIAQDKIIEARRRLNWRPRKCLGFKTPYASFLDYANNQTVGVAL